MLINKLVQTSNISTNYKQSFSPYFKSNTLTSDVVEFQLPRISEEQRVTNLIDAKQSEIDALNQEISIYKSDIAEAEKRLGPNLNSGWWFPDNELISKAKVKIRYKKEEIAGKLRYIRKLQRYLEQYRTDKRTAFLYNPDMSLPEKQNRGHEIGIYQLQDIPLQSNYKPHIIFAWLKTNRLETINVDDGRFIDTHSPHNEAFIQHVIDNKDNYLSRIAVCAKYNYREEELREDIKAGKFDFFGINDGQYEDVDANAVLIDLTGEKSINAIAEHVKTHPQPYQAKTNQNRNRIVPAAHLSRMGYGKASDIRKLVEDGVIAGQIKQVKKSGSEEMVTQTIVNVDDPHTRNILYTLRRDNKNIIELHSLAKKLNINYGRIASAIEDGEVDFIREFLPIHPGEGNKIFINKKNPNNQLFLAQLEFEHELALEIKRQRRLEQKQQKIEQMHLSKKLRSLRMTLAWQNCPKTKEIGSAIAVQDGYLCSLLEKEADGEELNQKERTKILSYRKTVWREAGTQELSDALKQAQEYIKQYMEGGLDAVEDEKARETIKLYFE